MAPMIGEGFIPESIQSRRRSLRNRLRNMRQPIMEFRQQNIPGPDVVGTVENNLMDLRDRFVNREKILSRIRSQTNNKESEEGGSKTKDLPDMT